MNREVLELLILAAVRAGPLHGYALIEELRRRSGGSFDLPEGTVYPALRRLERQGLLKSRWDSGTRARRVYRLTGKGKTALSEQERAWRSFARTVELLLEPA